MATMDRELAPVTAVPVPLPRDCLDGFFDACWRTLPELDLGYRPSQSSIAW
jgi:hypothetical protein